MTVPRQPEEVFVIRPPGLNKEQIRQQIWDRLEKENLDRFPRPIYGRIPNFVGAEKAASRLAERPEFANARTVKVNPDSPQRKVRELVMVHGKLLLLPAPRLRSGFLLLRPERVKGKERLASSIKGAFSLGEEVSGQGTSPGCSSGWFCCGGTRWVPDWQG